MARTRILTPLFIFALLTPLGLLGAAVDTSVAWASSHGMQGAPPMGQRQPMMQRRGAMGAQAPSPQLLATQPPNTLEGYIGFVQDKMQLEAMKVKQAGTAEVKLSIAKDGTVRQTEIVRAEGPAGLRDHIMAVVNGLGKLPPLPPDANADVVVVTTLLAFNYPGGELLDRFGQRPRRR